MIHNVLGSGRYIQVSSPISPHISNSGQSAGDMRFNLVGQTIKVYNGTSWQQVSGSATISLSAEAESLLDWANKKRNEEMRIAELAEKHPGLKDAWEKFEILKTLCSKETETSK